VTRKIEEHQKPMEAMLKASQEEMKTRRRASQENMEATVDSI
jgi:hypothetical protein